jgi:Xaa-Pro aminopeptidase
MPSGVCDLSPLVGDLRLRKSASEIESLRAACELSAFGHMEAMRFGRPELAEYQVQAAMEYVWREGGSSRNGYPSIVASGPNACILHYTENDRVIEDGDLVLIDAACEIDYFSSDITRTWPANGKFTPAQAAIYEVVLGAQKAAISTTRPGSTIRTTHEIATEILAEGLVELGLLPRGLEDSLAMNHQREFFMHGTSHWLGMDVHDAGTYRVEASPAHWSRVWLSQWSPAFTSTGEKKSNSPFTHMTTTSTWSIRSTTPRLPRKSLLRARSRRKKSSIGSLPSSEGSE